MSPNKAHQDSLTQDLLSTPINIALGVTLISQSSCNSSQTASRSPSQSQPQSTSVLSITTSRIHLTPTSTLHGGISTLLIDTACLTALIPTLSDGQSAATIASSFQILNALVGEGKVYEVEGRVTRRGKSVAFCEGYIRCEGVVIARGSVMKVIKEERKGKL